jgi:hypothetical protein
MEIADIYWTLRRRWFAVAMVLCIAAIAALLTAYRVTVSPLGLSSRVSTSGAATAQLLIDSPRSALADLTQDPVPLSTRAGIFAQFMSSNDVRDAIGRAARLRPDRITTQGPFSPTGGTINVPPPGAARGNQVADEQRAYRLNFVAQSELPIVTIFARAPTAAEAARLADASVTGVRSYVDGLQRTAAVQPVRRVVVRGLGSAQAQTVTSGGTKALAVLTFLAVSILGLILVLGITAARRHRLRTSWPAIERDEADDGSEPEMLLREPLANGPSPRP